MTVQIIALASNPDTIEAQYMGEGVTHLTFNACVISIDNEPKVGSLQIRLLPDDVSALTEAIGYAIKREMEHRRTREP